MSNSPGTGKAGKAYRLISGGLLRVSGLGILIIGDSGIGKSETALELISRGHKFISDDVTVITRSSRGKINGTAPDISRNFMEIRGLGIINIKKIFGENRTLKSSSIDFVVALKKWEAGKNYSRMGNAYYSTHSLLDKDLPCINIPIAPGRNIATLIEVACKVHLLEKNGYRAPLEISKKLDNVLQQNSKSTKANV